MSQKKTITQGLSPESEKAWEKARQELMKSFSDSGLTVRSGQDLESLIPPGTMVASFPILPKKQWVMVSVPWGYEEATIKISPKNWQRITEGEQVGLTSAGWNDGEKFSLYWNFNCSQYPLSVSSSDGADIYHGRIRNAQPFDRPPKATNKT